MEGKAVVPGFSWGALDHLFCQVGGEFRFRLLRYFGSYRVCMAR